MRERERNLSLRRMSFHYFEKDGILMVKILENGDPLKVEAWTRLWTSRGEIKRLKTYIDRIHLEGSPTE